MKRLSLILSLLLLPCFTALAGGEKWLTDFEKAKKQAAKEDKLILVEFTGSDWCPPCKLLHKEVFGQEKFIKEASKNFVLVELDFPQKAEQPDELRKQNRALAGKYKVSSFPTVLLTDAAGKEFARTSGYREGGVEPYLKYLKKLRDQKDMD